MWPAALLALALQDSPASPADGHVERRLGAMGTWLDLSVRAPERATALAASEAAVRAIERCEARLSTWRSDSELARLNAAPVGRAVELTHELARDLAAARGFWLATDGAFDPGLGALVEAWGLRTGGREPGATELTAARECGGFAAFELDGRRATRRHPLARIEEGGFGKGLGLDDARQALRDAGAEEAVLDLGGQVLVHGRAREVLLSDPDRRERPVLALLVEPGSLATSGNAERGIVVAGERRGHLLDPRSGAPAPDFGSLSVWAADALAADCLSTGLYVMGPERALAWRAARRAGETPVELVILLRSSAGLRALVSPGLGPRLRPLVPELVIELIPPPSRSVSTDFEK